MLAGAAAAAPIPAAWVERFYSASFYVRLQPLLTRASNLAPFALFDVLMLAIVGALIATVAADMRSRRQTAVLVLARAVLRTAAWTAALFLIFLAVWGLNYRRQPLVDRLRFDERAVSPDAALAAAVAAVDRVNELHDRAHATGWPAPTAVDPALDAAFQRVVRHLGVETRIVVARPKTSALDFYLRRAGVDGMTDPYFLETLVQRGLLPFERPFVVAHEWSHLAGFADESEANFVGWLTCLRGTAADQYSGWLFLYGELARAVAPRDRPAILRRLGPGPRADLDAAALRYRQQVNLRVARVGWRVYDDYLRANQVEAGTRSYDLVVRLVLGTRFGPDWTPQLR